MDRGTRAVYEASADRWLAERSARNVDLARALGDRSSGPSVDLGCGPGFHAAALAAPVVALDAAHAMLELVPQLAPDALRVQADLVALPFRRAALGAAWAHHSYVHVARHDLPLALADLHRALRVGAPIVLRLFAGDEEGAPFADDDFPGRFFALWPPDDLRRVVARAGFAIEGLDVAEGARGDTTILVRATSARALPDFTAGGLRLLLCGLNPSVHSADAGVSFVTGSNRFWPAALAAGIVSRNRDPVHAVRHHGIGFTDIVKRPTARADELTATEYRDGFAELERLVAWLEPEAVCFVGLSGWRAAVDRKAVAGWQPRAVGGRPAYVMPNPSGINAHATVDVIADHLRTAAAGHDLT